MDPLWFKIIFVLVVFLAQGGLWVWVLLKRRKVAPDVTVFNWEPLNDFLYQRKR